MLNLSHKDEEVSVIPGSLLLAQFRCGNNEPFGHMYYASN